MVAGSSFVAPGKLSMLLGRMGFQLGAQSFLVISFSQFVLGTLSVAQQGRLAAEGLRHDGEVLAKNVADAALGYLLAYEPTGMEQLLLSSAEFPEVASIKVTNPDGQIVANVARDRLGPPSATYDSLRLTPPADRNSTQTLQKEAFIFWHPIVDLEHRGWARLELRTDDIELLSNLIWRNTLLASFGAGGTSFLLLLMLLRPYLRAIRQAARFAGV